MMDDMDQPAPLLDEIAQYYDMGLEARRLFSGAQGELEYLRTQEIIRRHLPAAPALVLDVGGGPGAYALWLARAGYEVHLVDPVPLHVAQAQQAAREQTGAGLRSITRGDARRLGFPDRSADAVLLLGPLYHLTQRWDRLAALREAYRVLKPGGLVFAVGISRFASTLAGLIDGYFADAEFVSIARRDIAEGQHRNPSGKQGYFTTAFFHQPEQLRQEVVEAGFTVQRVLAVEGAAVFLQDLEEQWGDSVRRGRILEAVRWLESEPSVLGATGHVLAVATVPGQDG